MRPIDEFSYVKNNKVLLDSDSLSQLYHPVIGNHAVLLYEYLLAFFDDGIKRHKFSEILNHLQLSMQEVEEALASRLTGFISNTRCLCFEITTSFKS